MDATTPITLAEAANYFPRRRGRKLHLRTIKRRITRGCRGVRLNAFKDGGIWYTTQQWIREFQEACTRQAMPSGERTAAQQAAAQQRARSVLMERYGFHAKEQKPRRGRQAVRPEEQSSAQVPDLQQAGGELRPVLGLPQGGLPSNQLR